MRYQTFIQLKQALESHNGKKIDESMSTYDNYTNESVKFRDALIALGNKYGVDFKEVSDLIPFK
jgi:hypothetical protein